MRWAAFLMIAMMAVQVQAAIDASSAAGPSLKASLLKYEPVPAHPGDSLDVWVKLENTGGDVASDVKLEFVDNYPFKLESSDEKVHNVGSLPGRYDYVAKFKVRVDPSAPTGTANLKVRYGYGSNAWSEQFLSVDVESRITTLSVEKVEVVPETLRPGQEGRVEVTVKNLGESVIRRVSAKLDLEDSEAPLAPSRSATELKIESLNPGEEHVFAFNVIPSMEASPDAYKVPLKFGFTDDAGTEYSYKDLVGVVIASPPELEVIIDSTNLYSDKRVGTVALKFVNKGLEGVKSVYVKLLGSDSYELLSPSEEYYVGNIDSDDYEVQELKVKALSDNVEIPLRVEFKDSANKPYSKEVKVSLKLYPAELSGEKKSGKAWIAVVAAAALLLIYSWRKRKRE